MSVTSIFSSGRPTVPAPKSSGVLKYLPQRRNPWFPTTFRRENVLEKDLRAMWQRGRHSGSVTDAGSGYGTAPKLSVSQQPDVPLIPKHELEKFMPNISLGPKALVTPVTIMNARDGHRVTHDLIHSYDPYIGQLHRYKPAEVDHDNITPEDPNRVGLHGDTISCRARLYRWFRRGPFFNEQWYFRRTMVDLAKNQPIDNPAEHSLHRQVIRLARQGLVKEACEKYRQITYIPPVTVYRALMAACVPGALIADAVAIFEDGERLLLATRDAQVFLSLMEVCIAARHTPRVMWCYNLARGTWSENHYAFTPVQPLQMYQLCVKALEYLLDSVDVAANATHARTIVNYMTENGLTKYDMYIRLGSQLRSALTEGTEVIQLPTEEQEQSLPLCQAIRKALPEVAREYFEALSVDEQRRWFPTATKIEGTPLVFDETAIGAFAAAFQDVTDINFVLRLARFQGQVDLLATDADAYVQRVLSWLDALSDRESREGTALPYLYKSTPSTTNPTHVRVACGTAATDASPDPQSRLLPSEKGATFFYTPGCRFVRETFPTLNYESPESKYLARQPVQVEVAGFVEPESAASGDNGKRVLPGGCAKFELLGGGVCRPAYQVRKDGADGAPHRFIHKSVTACREERTSSATAGPGL